MKVRALAGGWSRPGPTAVIEHGANPGLISHFTKQGLLDIAQRVLEDRKVIGKEADEIRQLANDRVFNRLAMKLGVKVIHCSERDTQVTDRPKQVDEFVNTWSIEGFREEGTTTAEMGWGTHEKELPPLAYQHEDGPKNQICLARMGINTWVVSWVPDCPIHGMVVRHGEAFTISDRLTVWEDGRAVYRPTVHYAYCPCDAAIASLHELRGRDYQLQPRLRILNDEITSGADILGALLMGHAYQSWWTGSRLIIEESRKRRAPSERHHDAGGDFRGGGGELDDRQSRAGRLHPGRPAARRTSSRSASPTWAISSPRLPTGRRFCTTSTPSRASTARSSTGTIPGSSRTSSLRTV